MAYIDIKKLDDTQKVKLIENRWTSSSDIWDNIKDIYQHNTAVYENKSTWLNYIPERRRKFRVQANRVFVDMEAVINSLIANPPGINVIPARTGQPASEFARKLESYFRKKYADLNMKEVLRMGLRNLYFGRLLVIKPFWNTSLGVSGDFDYRAIDPRNVRIGKYARKEPDTEFVIEEIEDNLCAVIERFPAKKKDLMDKFGIKDENELYIKNPDVKYKEAWIQDYVIFKCENIILDTIKNPYWDWEGILMTDDEIKTADASQGIDRRNFIQNIKQQQPQREGEMAIPQPPTPETTPAQPQATDTQNPAPAPSPAPASQTQNQGEQPNPALVGSDFTQDADASQDAQQAQQPTPPKYKPYMFNYFDNPRKPYIFATVFNNENTPIGRTDMITLAAELQRGIDKRKMDIDENCEFMNGILKVDASVMGKSDAQRIRFETKGIIWGKGVKDGVSRETGMALPDLVYKDMLDSRSEIDNIMAATSAFRGETEGTQTKSEHLSLVEQSKLRLNELTQVVDYVSKEVFDWGMQLAKSRYTEYYSAKWLGKNDAQEMVEIIQDDFETGSEVVIIPGKTLPEDDQFKFDQAQNDVKAGYISPIDYLQIAGYDNAKELSKNAFLYKVSPFTQYDITDEERAKIPPPIPASNLRETIAFSDLPAAAKVQFLGRMGIQVNEQQIISEGDPTPVAISFKDLPTDGQIQAAAKAGITLDPQIAFGEKLKEHIDNQKSQDIKNNQVQPVQTPQ